MNLFLHHAREILEAAEAASAGGEGCSDMTILVGRDGAIRMLAGSDWPLEALARHHGAQASYRVSKRCGSVRVEGREESRTCLLESVPPSETRRRLLGCR